MLNAHRLEGCSGLGDLGCRISPLGHGNLELAVANDVVL